MTAVSLSPYTQQIVLRPTTQWLQAKSCKQARSSANSLLQSQMSPHRLNMLLFPPTLAQGSQQQLQACPKRTERVMLRNASLHAAHSWRLSFLLLYLHSDGRIEFHGIHDLCFGSDGLLSKANQALVLQDSLNKIELAVLQERINGFGFGGV